jgi:MerR family mercuric resistance operon transcriptional regulator
MASDRLAALDEKIAVPEGARTALGRLRKTCTSGTKGPCPILEAFEE